MQQLPLVEQLAAVLTSRQRHLRHAAELTSRKRSRQLAAAHAVQGTNNLSMVFGIPGGDHLPGILLNAKSKEYSEREAKSR
jgi:gamma-glutamyltranspeptidase